MAETVGALLQESREARGLSLDGQTEEQIRAEAAAESRHLVDVFLNAVRAEVPEEEIRDRIAAAVLSRLPDADDDGEDG